eukprot:scaffold18267_cov146-Isochrysis_galbana.AAC.3
MRAQCERVSVSSQRRVSASVLVLVLVKLFCVCVRRTHQRLWRAVSMRRAGCDRDLSHSAGCGGWVRGVEIDDDSGGAQPKRGAAARGPRGGA